MTSKQFRRNPILQTTDSRTARDRPPRARAGPYRCIFELLAVASLRYLHRFHRCGPILAPRRCSRPSERAQRSTTPTAVHARSTPSTRLKNERRPPHARARRDRARIFAEGLRRAAVAGHPGARRGRPTGRSRRIVRPGGRGQDVVITPDLRELVPAGLARRRLSESRVARLRRKTKAVASTGVDLRLCCESV